MEIMKKIIVAITLIGLLTITAFAQGGSGSRGFAQGSGTKGNASAAKSKKSKRISKSEGKTKSGY